MKSIKYDTLIQKIIDDVFAYYKLLTSKGFRVCFFRPSPVFSPYMEKLNFFFGHPFEKCIRVKERYFSACKKHQDELVRTAKTDAPTLFTCFAGVCEYVLPIEHEEKRYGLLSLSGYRQNNKQGDKAHTLLSSDLPEEETAKGVLLPFVYMFRTLIPLLNELNDEKTLSGSEKAYKKTLAFIAENAERQFSYEELCNYVGYSQAYIGREFRQRTGKSVFEYAADFRIKTAQKLLLDTRLSITDVAFSVGYADPNYFSNVFKMRTGVSPKVWRNQATGKISDLFPHRAEKHHAK